MTGWVPVGRVAVDGFESEVVVGPLTVPATTERLLIRARDPSGRPTFPFGYGLVFWRSAAGREFGTGKVYGQGEWEVVELPVRAQPQETVGTLIFEPRSYNTKWLRADPPQIWTLDIEAKAMTLASSSTGPVIETGENYVIWSDGQGREWMDCWGIATTSSDGSGGVKYPRNFETAPTVTLSGETPISGLERLAVVATPLEHEYPDWLAFNAQGRDYTTTSGTWVRKIFRVHWRAVGVIKAAP